MTLKKAQREFVADKLMDGANLALGGLVFGQLVTDRVQALLLILGLLLYFGGWTVAVRMKKGVKRT